MEFLNLIRNAKAVVTNSFHGSLFCSIFQVPFAVCLQRGASAAQNSRFFSTHSRLGQAHRIFSVGNLPVAALEFRPTEFEQNACVWRDESLAFLRDPLSAIADRQ